MPLQLASMQKFVIKKKMLAQLVAEDAEGKR
jgi:ADP-glucose pyrophosphorylase